MNKNRNTPTFLWTAILCLSCISLFFVSCKKDVEYADVRPDSYKSPILPEEYFDYSTETAPDHFQNDLLYGLFGYFDSPDGVTDAGATLGRVLFYDKNLSRNNTISCGSCHHQDKAFADGKRFSEGVYGELTERNSMAIFNTKVNRRLFWDSSSGNEFQQVIVPIENPIEMDMTRGELVEKIQGIPYYKELFIAAFGDEEVTSNRIREGLAQFITSIDSYTSKYDLGIENNFSDFTDMELQGKELFYSGVFRCNQCHSASNVGGANTMNTGLDEVYSDNGQGGFNGNEDDIAKFKAVSLRNIELTGPYMHDGRFETLEEVIDFYSTEVNAHPNLDDRLTVELETGGTPIQFNITEEEKAQLIAFMKTLTDPQLISDVKYSDPFDY